MTVQAEEVRRKQTERKAGRGVREEIQDVE